jgi:hypothetical protein
VAHPFGPRWPTLRELIELFVMMGCVQQELSGHLEGPDGSHPIRYLYSPVTDDFVSLLNYEDDEGIPPSEVANWERRLGVSIPKDPQWTS